MKKLFIILLLAIFVANVSYAQSQKTDDAVYGNVDVIPKFRGGVIKMYDHISKNLKYPEPAIKANITGKVFAQMIIEKDGSINNITILKGIGYGCDEEVQRVLKTMPKWTAGIKDGKAVRTSFTLPVMFAFDKKDTK